MKASLSLQVRSGTIIEGGTGWRRAPGVPRLA